MGCPIECPIKKMTVEVCLSHKGLSRLAYDSDFELVIDSESIKCSKPQISFISPVVTKMLRCDRTVREFRLKTAGSSSCAGIMRDLLCGSIATVSEDKKETFISIIRELRNEELASMTLKAEEFSLRNAINIVKIKHGMSIDFEDEIEFISSHFYEFEESKFSNLDISIIECILMSDSLVVNSERDLLDFIRSLISSRGADFRSLLCHLHLEYLDPESISFVIYNIDGDNIGLFLPCIFRRLICPIESIPYPQKRDRFSESSFPFIGNAFDGIFSHLWKKANGNPVTNGIVAIEETKNYTQNKVQFLVDPSKRVETNWYCGTSNNGLFIVDFKDRKVSLNGYSFKAHSSAWNVQYLIKAWKIEGSNDKKTWETVDEQKSDALLCNMTEGHWSCKESLAFRYFRIMLIENNISGTLQVAFHAIEFFGIIA